MPRKAVVISDLPMPTMQMAAMSSVIRIGVMKMLMMFLTQNSSVMVRVMPCWER